MDTIVLVASKSPLAPHFTMLKTSLRLYAEGFEVSSIAGKANPYGSFGEAYNALIAEAVARQYRRIIIANDDVVLRPDTMTKLVEDADRLDESGIRWQWLAARTDWVRHTPQNIRYAYGHRELRAVGYPEENQIVEVPAVSPIFAMIRADRWQEVGPFLPISWFSDDEHCYRGAKLGLRSYVSRAYVHHVGSQTMTPESWKAQQEAATLVLANQNPDFLNYYCIPFPQSPEVPDDYRF